MIVNPKTPTGKGARVTAKTERLIPSRRPRRTKDTIIPPMKGNHSNVVAPR